MAAVLVVVRAGLIGFAMATVLTFFALVLLIALRLLPGGELGWTLGNLIALAATTRVFSRGMRWVPRVPVGLLWHPGGHSDVAAAFRIGLAFMVLQWIAQPILGGNWPSLPDVPSPLQVAGVFAAAAEEEVMFRGYLLGLLLRAGRPWEAFWVSSAIFGIAHLPGQLSCDGFSGTAMLIPLLDWTVSGMVLATMTILCGRIWPAVLLHAAHNLLAGLSSESDLCSRVEPKK